MNSPEESLSFRFTVTGAIGNSVGTLALRGTKDGSAYTVVAGSTYSGNNGATSTTFRSGACANNSSDAYLLNSDAGWGGNTWNITSDVTTLGTLSASATEFVGNIAWQDTSFVMTLTQGAQSATYDLRRDVFAQRHRHCAGRRVQRDAFDFESVDYARFSRSRAFGVRVAGGNRRVGAGRGASPAFPQMRI